MNVYHYLGKTPKNAETFCCCQTPADKVEMGEEYDLFTVEEIICGKVEHHDFITV